MPQQVLDTVQFRQSWEELMMNCYHFQDELVVAYTQAIHVLSNIDMAHLCFDLVRFPVDFSIPELGVKFIESAFAGGTMTIKLWFKLTNPPPLGSDHMRYMDGRTVTLVDCQLSQ